MTTAEPLETKAVGADPVVKTAVETKPANAGTNAETSKETLKEENKDESTDPKKKEQEDLHAGVPYGMVPEPKNLYQSKKDDDGKRSWVETLPDDLDAPAENDKTARYALLVRNVKCYDGVKKLSIHSIIIQSPLLRKALGSVVDNYPGITVGLDRMKFVPPFEPFVHRWAKLRTALENEQDPDTKAHLQLLHDILEVELRSEIRARDDLIAHGVIDFESVWMLFEPGCIVFSRKDGHPCAAKVTNSWYDKDCNGSPVYSLSARTVDFNGEKFGYNNTTFSVNGFKGTLPIAELSALPLRYHPDKEARSRALIQRGKKFERLSGYAYKHYEGIGIGKGMFGRRVAYNVNSRVILDNYAWNRFMPNEQVYVDDLGTSTRSEDFSPESEEDSEDYDALKENPPTPSNNKATKIPRLTKDQLLLCTPTLKGYSFKEKQWITFFVDSVREIKWNENAFSRLVLPQDQKDMILALTESQRASKSTVSTFNDIIQGKGMGMIMLLAGPPGVGKTLTAESLAEDMKAPLYMMSAADLGSDSDELEEKLLNVLEMCTKWNAVLLLDEADVYLEERSSHDLERNKLVSIFLRTLEYYEGILFLTTNRASQIDPAFQSRIHMCMDYLPLNEESRKHVWKNFLKGIEGHGFSDGDVDKVAKYEMNGREIKNVLKTAGLLAARRGGVVGWREVETVVSAEKRYGATRK